MSEQNEWVLWENDEMSLQAAFNPAIPREEGLHIVLLQKKNVPSPWSDPELFSRMSMFAAKVGGVLINMGMADWVNIHCDGNIGAAKGNPKMHIHIFGRLKTGRNWGGPLQLPSGEGPYGHEPLSVQDRERLRSTLKYMMVEDMPEIYAVLRELRKLLKERNDEYTGSVMMEITAGGPPPDTFWISNKIDELKGKLIELLGRC